MTLDRRSTLLLLALAACGGGGGGKDDAGPISPGAVAGSLTVHLTDPSAGDAAILIRVTGPAMRGNVVSLASGARLDERDKPGEITIALFGKIVSGDVVRFDVPDVAKVDEYSATVVDAADGTNALRPSLSGYAAGIVK